MNHLTPHEDPSLEKDPRIAFFDSHAARWTEYNPSPETILARFDSMKSSLAIAPGRNVLELGCGPGQYTGWICREVQSARVTAIDFSPAMIAEACKQTLPAEFMVSDICSEAPDVHAYHTAFCYNAFPHFRDKMKALQNIAKSLKENGVFVILHFFSSQELNQMHHQVGGAVGHDELPTLPEMEKLLSETGFRLLESKDEAGLYFVKASKV